MTKNYKITLAGRLPRENPSDTRFLSDYCFSRFLIDECNQICGSCLEVAKFFSQRIPILAPFCV